MQLKKGNQPVDLYYRVKFFDRPFAYVILNYVVDKFCSYCLRRVSISNACECRGSLQLEFYQNVQQSCTYLLLLQPASGQLQFCAKCKHARYCSKECQKHAWRDHKPECARLVAVFPNLPTSEVLFLGRILDKLKYVQIKGDVHGWFKERTFDSLISHTEEIKQDTEKMASFEKFRVKAEKYLGSESPPTDEFFLVFCRTWINSHSIHNSSGTEIGIAMDLGVSKYDHSCRPNASLVFDGFNAMIRPLTPTVDVSDTTKAFISYTDLGRSKYQRRLELKAKWYFWCECERCMDPEDDRLTSIKCANPDCGEAIIITETSDPTPIACPKCQAVTTTERIKEAQQLMLNTIPTKFTNQETTEELKALVELSETILHIENVYYCRLLTAFLHKVGPNEYSKSAEQHRLVYQNFCRVFPKADRHVGYQLLHLVQSLIEEGKRDEAVPYAYEAMTIFEVCFGLEHPFYLQALALWTYLDKKSDKTDKELLSLLNFNERDTKPIDISSLLTQTEGLDLLANEHS